MTSDSPTHDPVTAGTSTWPTPTVVESDSTFRQDAVALGMLLAISCFVALVYMPFSLYRADNLAFYLPWYTHLGESLRNLDIPGWLPTTMSGVPFAGDPQSGWGYLPAMVIFTIFPSVLGYKIFLVFHVLVAAAFAFLYARNLGIRAVGAFGAGAVFTLGNFMERVSCCTIHMQVAIWIPAAMLCIDRSQLAVTKRGRIAWLVAGGLVVSQILAGWVGQGAYYGCLAVGIYLIYRTFVRPRSQWQLAERVKPFVLAVVVLAVIGGSASATAILPRLDVVSRSNLADLYEDGSGAPSESGWKIELLAERMVGPLVREGRWYLGVVALSLMLIAPLLLGRRRDVVFFALFSLGALSMIIRDSPVTWVFNLLPRFESLHAHSPDRIYAVLFIGPAILAGEVIDAISNRAWKPPRPLRLAIALQTPVVLIVAALILVKEEEAIWIPASRILMTVLACLAVGIGSQRDRRWLSTIGVVGVLALILADPAGRLVYSRLTDEVKQDLTDQILTGNLNDTGASSWLKNRADEGEVFRFFGYDLEALTVNGNRQTYVIGNYRPLTYSLLVNNRSIRLGLEDIQGYNPVQIKRYVNFFTALNFQTQSYHTANVLENGIDSRLLNLLNARYIVVPAVVPPDRPDLLHLSLRYRTVYSDEISRILENPAALPRAWIVHEAIKTDTGDLLEQLASGAIDPLQTVLLDTDTPKLKDKERGVVETVEIVSYEPDEIRLRVDVESRSMVILSEIWDPGWSATVDGERARVYRADYLLRGILLEDGEHEIVLRFEATDVKRSMLLYIVPLFAVVGLIGLGFVGSDRGSKNAFRVEIDARPQFVTGDSVTSDENQSATERDS